MTVHHRQSRVPRTQANGPTRQGAQRLSQAVANRNQPTYAASAGGAGVYRSHSMSIHLPDRHPDLCRVTRQHEIHHAFNADPRPASGTRTGLHTGP